MRSILALTAILGLAACAGSGGGNPPARTFVVFFTLHSSALEPSALQVIAQAAEAAKAAPGLGVLVVGHTDSIGSKPDDVVLSQVRARRVAAALIADGVAGARISSHGSGQTGEDPGVESRRVDITFTN